MLRTERSGGRPAVRRRYSGDRQDLIWKSVRTVQERLSASVRSDVADKRSRSSLQLSLENETLAAALADYEKALGGLPDRHPDAVGYAFAIGNRLNSGDEFAGAALFRKLWRRQLRAAATETLGEAPAGAGDPPAPAAVARFIDRARAAEPVRRTMPGGTILVTRESETSLHTETRRIDGRWVHRSFISAE